MNRTEAVLLLLRAIFRDEIVMIEEVGGPYPGHRRVLDLREPDALAEFLTDPGGRPIES